MKHIQLTKRDGTCEPGWERKGDLCVKKGAPQAEVDQEIREFHKSLKQPRKQEMEFNKRLGVPFIKSSK